MDSSDVGLDRIEAQRSTDESHGLIYLVMQAFRKLSLRIFFGEDTQPPRDVFQGLMYVVLQALRRLIPGVFYTNREECTPSSTDVSEEQDFLDASPVPTTLPNFVNTTSASRQRRSTASGRGLRRLNAILSIILPRRFFRSRRDEENFVDASPLFSPESLAAATETYSTLGLSKFLDRPNLCVKMNPDIFSAVSNGRKECLEKLRIHKTPLACYKSVQGDSILHLAARWNHKEIVRTITCEYPCLLMDLNNKDQLPIHLAAHAGHLTVVKTLVATIKNAQLSEEDLERLNPYVAKDIDENTPLHVALKRRDMDVAFCLVKENKQASFLANKEGMSPLFMAVEAAQVSLVKEMLNTGGNDNIEIEGRKYLAHAALKSRSTDMLDVILKAFPRLVNDRDEKGWSCLSFGAFIGFYDGVCYLLDQSPESVYESNDDGSFPIHLAVEKSRTRISEEFLKRYPDSKHLLNKKGQNILHVAAKSGHHRLARSWMLHEETRHLGVEQDMDGNTPLHLATINWRSNCISTFVWDEDILQLQNNKGKRARDIAESEVKSNYIYEERLTLALLLYATHHSLGEPIKSMTKPSDPASDTGKDYVNTLLLVAALVATMTFAAGFTMPGGFNSSGPNLGKATLANNPTLFVFLLVDTLAMQCSFATIATLIWAQMGDKALVRSSLNVALPLLLIALLCMPLAFLFGMVTAISHVKWFLIVICVISSVFFYWALFILAPHVLLQLSNVSPDTLGNYLVVLIRCEDCLRYLHHLYLGMLKWTRRRLFGKSGRRSCVKAGK